MPSSLHTPLVQPHIPVPILIFVIVSIKMSIFKFIKYYSEYTSKHHSKKISRERTPGPPLWVRPDHFIFASSSERRGKETQSTVHWYMVIVRRMCRASGIGYLFHSRYKIIRGCLVPSWAEPDHPWREVGLQAYLGFVLAPYQIAAFFTWLGYTSACISVPHQRRLEPLDLS